MKKLRYFSIFALVFGLFAMACNDTPVSPLGTGGSGGEDDDEDDTIVIPPPPPPPGGSAAWLPIDTLES